ncbi:MAG: PepSY-associated TM helix domain-containing protein [Gemmatimonadetes bacterium]|nr:PepSY-associated TM helix domain-containing protein [Gemmatimonadota bacterium]
MESEPTNAAPDVGSRLNRDSAKVVWSWTRRLHFYLGLYFLLFIWLFSISGLVLNHGKWEFADYWPDREESTATRAIEVPTATGDLAVAKDLMRQLGLSGEVNRTERKGRGDEFAFQVGRPGHVFDVEANLATGRAEVKQIEVNVWGIMSALHHFTGVKIGEPEKRRDWWLTTVWIVAMDAIALGLIVLVASGLYLWYHLQHKRTLGLVALTAGTLCWGFFLFGLGFL